MLTDQLKLHFIVFIWGFTSILGVLITIPAIEIVFFRTLIAAIALSVLFYIIKKKPSFRRSAVLKLLGTGALVGLHWILFFAAAKVSKVSICLAGMATCTLFTAFLEPLINRTKIKWYEVMLGVIVIAGLYTIFHFEFDHVLGIGLALASAFLAALFSILNSRFTKKEEPLIITFYEMIGACILCALFMPLYDWFWAEESTFSLALTTLDVVYLLILSLICTVFAFYVSVEIMKRISAFNVNLAINLEPVYGIILAFIIFGEREKMSLGFYAGAVVILFAVLGYPTLNRFFGKRRQKANVITASATSNC